MPLKQKGASGVGFAYGESGSQNAKIAAGKELADEEVLKKFSGRQKHRETIMAVAQADGKICDRERKRS